MAFEVRVPRWTLRSLVNIIFASLIVYWVWEVACRQYFLRLKSKCGADDAPQYLSIGALNNQICKMVLTTEDLMAYPAGPLTFWVHTNLYIVLLVLMAVEGSRQSTGPWLPKATLLVSLCQLMGGVTGFTGFWLTLYLQQRLNGFLAHTGNPAWCLNNAPRVRAIGGYALAVLLPALGVLLLPEGPGRSRAHTWLQMAPVLLTLAWSMFMTRPRGLGAAKRGANAALLMYTALAGGLLVLHAVAIVHTIGNSRGSLAGDLWAAMRRPGRNSSSHACHYKLLDLAGMLVGMLMFVVQESGWRAAATLAALSPVISPGAAFAFYLGLHREPDLQSKISSADVPPATPMPSRKARAATAAAPADPLAPTPETTATAAAAASADVGANGKKTE